MNSTAAIDRAIALHLCPRCIILFLAPKNEAILKLSEEEVRINAQEKINALAPGVEYNTNIDHKICPCCFDAYAGETLDKLSISVSSDLSQKGIDLKRPTFLIVVIPPMLDTARVTTRTIITSNNEKSFSFPSITDLIQRLLGDILRINGVNIVHDVSTAEIQVTVTALIPNQTEFCQAIYSDYRHRKKKKRFGETTTGDLFEVSRTDADTILTSYKTLNTNTIVILEKSMKDYMTTQNVEPVSWGIEATARPLYLLGRYRKYARDVPQAPWTLGDERKGRNSVEEILSEAVLLSLKATSCKMHACGREDIDVRCLGNGRPFVLEVTGAYSAISKENLQAAIDHVSTQSVDSLNRYGDVEMLMLRKADRSVWENMQTVAEEKKKAYRCVCWSSGLVDREKLKILESKSAQMDALDTDGIPCLKLIQKTPLRVLHRRSLLDRSRDVYNIQTVLLNDHFFLMDITTSAGTYVKEFVHGDLGRTSPSVCGIFGCQVDILQLDVVWLFDDFEGGGDRRDDKKNELLHK
mmetsp:Transcript_5065/g.5187  ORF Transcript_5065/g.5187 Transcript_5065/m.5187 type:complete len:524 (+) Transcript_5065:187-1758(+)